MLYKIIKKLLRHLDIMNGIKKKNDFGKYLSKMDLKGKIIKVIMKNVRTRPIVCYSRLMKRVLQAGAAVIQEVKS